MIPRCSVPVETRAGTGTMQHEICQFLHSWTCLQSVAMQQESHLWHGFTVKAWYFVEKFGGKELDHTVLVRTTI